MAAQKSILQTSRHDSDVKPAYAANLLMNSKACGLNVESKHFTRVVFAPLGQLLFRNAGEIHAIGHSRALEATGSSGY